MTKQKGTAEPQNELAVVKEKIQGMQAMIDSSPVTNDDELNAVADKIKNVKDLGKAIKAKKDLFVAPAKAIIEEARTTWDPMIKACENAELTLKSRVGKYMTEKEQKIEAERAKIAARVEKGTLKEETAVAKMEALPETPKTVRTDTGSGVRMNKRKVAKIVDASQIPDEFWIVDEVRVRREALERERYGKDPIPGVTVTEESYVASV